MQQKHRWYMYRRKKEQEFPAPFLNVVCQNKLSAVCLKMSYDSYFLSVKITQKASASFAALNFHGFHA